MGKKIPEWCSFILMNDGEPYVTLKDAEIKITQLEKGIGIAIKMLDIHNQFGVWTEGLERLRLYLKALGGKDAM